MIKRYLFVLALLFTYGVYSTSSTPTDTHLDELVPTPIAEDVLRTWTQEELPFELVFDRRAEKQIARLLRSRSTTQALLDRADHYLPDIERALADCDLPNAFKYLPMVESRLRPDARSQRGAVGLWQLMPRTARKYGCVVNRKRDDRLDPALATACAINNLNRLYREFEDWTLVLAAYNCGATKVRKSLKATGGSTYDDIQHLLPSQTRAYLPYFLATAYVHRWQEELGFNE